MDVAYCFDKNYRQHFGVSLCSLVKNFDVKCNLNVYIVTDEIDSDFVKDVESIIQNTHCTLNWIEFDINTVKYLPVAKHSHFTSAIYYRIFLPELLPTELNKIVYLDSDTICINDISKLDDLDLNESYILGVLDIEHEKESNRLGVKNYINSGVLVLNLDQWRTLDISKKCLLWLEKNKRAILGDQDAINFVCQDNMKLISDNWNFCINPANTPQSNTTPNIIHYITSLKPWLSWYDDQLAGPYDHYRKLTPWASIDKSQPKTVNEWIYFAQKLNSNGKHKESAIVYEQIIQELLKKLK